MDERPRETCRYAIFNNDNVYQEAVILEGKASNNSL